MLTVSLDDHPTPAPLPPTPSNATPGNAPAPLPQNDRLSSAPLPLSQREQQVCEYLSQGVSFEAIARHLNCSPAAARAYHRRALDKRQRTTALAPLEQGDRSAQSDRSTTAKPGPASAKPSDHRPASAPAFRCERSPFHSPAVEAPVPVERPSPLELYVSSLFVTGEPVSIGDMHSPQSTITEPPPRLPRRRKRFSRRSRRTSVAVDLAELEGLSLYLWSEHDVEGRALEDYRNGDQPLQGLLLQTCDHQGDRLASAELVRCVGQRFVFASEVPLCF